MPTAILAIVLSAFSVNPDSPKAIRDLYGVRTLEGVQYVLVTFQPFQCAWKDPNAHCVNINQTVCIVQQTTSMPANPLGYFVIAKGGFYR
jgi:hypothetical protein